MGPEDQLDALLDQALSGRTQRSAVSDELKPLISAAARLDAFRDATPADAFSRDLEARLLARMAQPAVAAHGRERPSEVTRGPVHLRRDAIPLRTRAAWAGIAAALLVTIGLGALTAKAAPGGPLYLVRQFAQSIAAHALPSSTVDASALIAQLQADLAAYDHANTQGDMPAALAALAKLRTDDQHAARLIGTISDAKSLASAQAQLAAFHASANGDLRASLPGLSLPGRAAVTDLLREWGYSTLTVKSAHISADSKPTNRDTHSSTSGTDGASVIVEVHGTGFDASARVLINGQPYGSILAQSATSITVRAPQSALGGGQWVIGVENGDGTVAFAATSQRDDQAGSSADGTPGATSKDSGRTTPDETVTPLPGSSNP